MNPSLNTLLLILAIGAGATIVMDAWLLLLRSWGIATLNFAFVGRWVGHLFRGQVFHSAIARAEPIRGERSLGWIMHYAVGIAFAALLVGVEGASWTQQPTLLPALILGMITAAVPLFFIQPAMGSGIASRRTQTPLLNCLKSLANHSVFGIGLYLAAAFIAAWTA